MLLLKHYAEYLALRFVAGLVSILPYRAALFVGWLNAILMFHVFRFRVATAKHRIRLVFGEKYSNREINRIVWQSYRNIVFNAIDMVRMGRMTREWFNSYTEFQSVFEALGKQAATKRGAIIATAHLGSWELAAVVCQHAGVPIFSIAAKQKNPFTNEYLNLLRQSTGLETIARGSGLTRDILRNLAAGKSLAILPDVRMPIEAISVPFLGGIANIGGGMAGFARHAEVPIIPCIVTRIGWTRHKAVAYDPILPDMSLSKEDDISRMTLAVMKIIDDAIRSNPGQWFWFNKRWILDPLPEKKEDRSQNTEFRSQ